ncbi:isopenicillin N synthase family dioxygenase [Hyphomicrobium sp.]|uniref:isopenicillin N synthase family dioxygenase n=1 Tax=Hyphomicrobium sp. TaxID=82 RepID=UPI002D774CF6|nr:2-oxoglutarate and iron-dependent oxygenase domain-containing protein [Hyphomicrobium sp.]HET6387960.1 2-oxoglutarate and iron-dependent oxygenase domain-containing protein [Hyphomicrobium sp.]
MSASETFQSIPIVDVTKLRTGTLDEQKAVAEELGKAARDVGFVYITGGGIDESLFEGVLDATKRFFALPHEEKMKVYIGNSRCHRGYVPEGEEVFASGSKDKKEAYDLSMDLPADDPDYVAGNPLLGPNQWPDLPGFAQAVDDYYRAVFGLGRVLLRGFSLALGEEPTFFDKYVTKPPSQLRLIHYPFDASAEDRPGIGAHTDYECFTLLRSTAAGLEVLNGAGEWIDAPPIPGAYVVNIGDMMEVWTNGTFVATSHRVRKVSEERYSFPLFFAADYDTVVAPLPRFAEEGKALRSPLKAGEHLFAQTAQSFTYLKERVARGELALPQDAAPLSSFGQEARLKY